MYAICKLKAILQVEALLVMAFFCMYPFRNSVGDMPTINFNGLYSAMDR